MELQKIRALIAQMTLEEKASLCSGADAWHTEEIGRLGIPASMVADGPHGLRKMLPHHKHVHESVEAVCFPTGCATSGSFNRALLEQMGAAIGNECQAEGVQVLLGPAMNIKRSPLCGRNFEYYSEDPYLASQTGAAFIRGVQSQGVGTAPKHFLANNQEHRRMTSSSEMDERTLREIYLAAFESAVRDAKPWTVMCSYNRINGIYAAENKKFLTDILRGEWGFDGYVMSDWGAVNDRVPDLEAGLELEMPSSGGQNDRLIVEAVREGRLDEAVLDQAVERLLNILYRGEEARKPNAIFNRDQDHELARRVAEETIVLLKNDGILPLTSTKKVAFIGHYAEKPRFQGGGSSHITAHEIVSACAAVSAFAEVSYAQGFDGDTDERDDALFAAAVETAQAADIAVIFAGLPDTYESEGYDRAHMRLPQVQDDLIHAVCQVQKQVVVVLHNGSPVEMPWVEEVQGILEAYLGGEAVGSAVVDILYGKVNPSARLPESFPKKLQDNPSYLYYRGERNRTEYREGVFVGYRYYDKKDMDVLFPFGHGLSYTTFAYENFRLSADRITADEELTVSLDVVNTGNRAGAEVVQLYVEAPEGEVIRPVRELRNFEKVFLQPGERKTVTMTLSRRAFAYWEMQMDKWFVESGDYRIQAARSSREIVCEAVVTVTGDQYRETVTLDTTLGDLMEHDGMRKILLQFLREESRFSEEQIAAITTKERPTDMALGMLRYEPLRFRLRDHGLDYEKLYALIDALNHC